MVRHRPPMRRSRRPALWALLLLGLAAPAQAQLPQPRITSVFPPGTAVGQTVEVTLQGTDLENVETLWFSHPGITAKLVKPPVFQVTVAPDVPSGIHDVRVASAWGVSNPRLFAVGSYPEGRETEPNNEATQSNALALPFTMSGQINPAADVDWFHFAGRTGQKLILRVEASSIESRVDPLVRVFDPAGKEIANSEQDPGPDALLCLKLKSTGRYTVKIHDVIYAGSADHVYRLSIDQAPWIDAVVPAALPAGATADVTVIGRNLGEGATPVEGAEAIGLEKKKVSVTMPADGAALADMDLTPSTRALRAGITERIQTPGGWSNPFFVARAVAPPIVETEPNDDLAQAPEQTLPLDLTGTFATLGDLDVVRFRAKPGTTWLIRAEAHAIGSGADPSFIVQKVDEKGQASDIASGDDTADAAPLQKWFPEGSVDAVLAWQAPAEGLYQVVLQDLYGSQRGDARLTYRLTITPVEPKFRLALMPANPGQIDGLSLRAGGRTAVSVVVRRTDGFAAPVRIEAIGLPQGVTSSPVIVGPTQPLATLVLRAAADAPASLGPIEVVGVSVSGDRKELLGAAPATSIAWEAKAIPGALSFPPAGPESPVLARVARGYLLAVRPGAPFEITAPETISAAAGEKVELKVKLERRAGFTEVVKVNGADLPASVTTAEATIDKDKTEGVVALTIDKAVPPGVYTIHLKGTGAFPFNKDPNAKEKPNVNVVEPSNTIVLTVRKP